MDTNIQAIPGRLAKLILLALAILGLNLGTSWAQQMPCAPYEDVAKGLQLKYGEHVIGQGTSEGGESVLQIFVNPETRSWTVIALMTNGMGCILTAGNNWQLPAIEEKGEPS